MMKRPRIKTRVCVATTGNIQTMSIEQQNEIERSHRLLQIKKIEERINNAPVVHTTTVVYNPTRHKYAVVWGKKVLIKTEEEYNIYISSGFTITNH